MQNQAEIERLKKVSNPELFKMAKEGVKIETNATLTVLYILREIERRRAFVDQNCPSLFEFCVDYLGYKRGAAYRRITALKALKDIPEVEEKIQNGSLDLMTLTQAQGYFSQKRRNNEPLAKEEKLEILENLENKSTRECEKFFLELNPNEIPREKLTPVDSESSELSLHWPKRIQEKLEKLKSLMGPEKSSVQTIEAIEVAFDIAIRGYEIKYSRSEKKTSASASASASASENNLNKTEVSKKESEKIEISKTDQKVPALGKSKHFSVHIKREVWKKDQGQCSFMDPRTKQRCSSKYKLEIDHIEAKAIGGADDIDNLRLLCKAHNQWAAIKQFGLDKMEVYLS